MRHLLLASSYSLPKPSSTPRLSLFSGPSCRLSSLQLFYTASRGWERYKKPICPLQLPTSLQAVPAHRSLRREQRKYKMPPEPWFQPPTTIPPRTSSTGMANGTSPGSVESALKVIPELEHSDARLQTKPDGSHTATTNGSGFDSTKYKDGMWSQENERIVLGPYNYMLQHPGKDIRRQLINAFNAWLRVPSESLAIITKVVAMLHTASLMYVGLGLPSAAG